MNLMQTITSVLKEEFEKQAAGSDLGIGRLVGGDRRTAAHAQIVQPESPIATGNCDEVGLSSGAADGVPLGFYRGSIPEHSQQPSLACRSAPVKLVHCTPHEMHIMQLHPPIFMLLRRCWYAQFSGMLFQIILLNYPLIPSWFHTHA